MIDYDWLCFGCNKVSPAKTDKCVHCGTPAITSSFELSERNSKQGDDKRTNKGIISTGFLRFSIPAFFIAVVIYFGFSWLFVNPDYKLIYQMGILAMFLIYSMWDIIGYEFTSVDLILFVVIIEIVSFFTILFFSVIVDKPLSAFFCSRYPDWGSFPRNLMFALIVLLIVGLIKIAYRKVTDINENPIR